MTTSTGLKLSIPTNIETIKLVSVYSSLPASITVNKNTPYLVAVTNIPFTTTLSSKDTKLKLDNPTLEGADAKTGSPTIKYLGPV